MDALRAIPGSDATRAWSTAYPEPATSRCPAGIDPCPRLKERPAGGTGDPRGGGRFRRAGDYVWPRSRRWATRGSPEPWIDSPARRRRATGPARRRSEGILSRLAARQAVERSEHIRAEGAGPGYWACSASSAGGGSWGRSTWARRTKDGRPSTSASPTSASVARYMAGKTRSAVETRRVSDDSSGEARPPRRSPTATTASATPTPRSCSSEPADALLLLGVDDSEKVWVNGEKVFELFTSRGLAARSGSGARQAEGRHEHDPAKALPGHPGLGVLRGSSPPTAGPSRLHRRGSEPRDCEAPAEPVLHPAHHKNIRLQRAERPSTQRSFALPSVSERRCGSAPPCRRPLPP